MNDREVQYSNLAPRHYRFRVMASNNCGVWNEQGDTLEFSVDPAYYQTNWFRATCLAGLMALLWAAYQLRVRKLHHEFAMGLEARLDERTRIARDLHDTLLQSFHGLLLRFQTASQLLPDRPMEAKDKLDGAIDQAAEALRNAFRHAQARQIEVEIRYDNEQFRLRVRDDGKGIDAAVLSSQGRGTLWLARDAGTRHTDER